MADRERILQAVYRAVDALNQQLRKSVSVTKAPDAVICGKPGKLESIDVVTLIMEVEDQVKAEFGTSITIADDRAMSRENSPFLTVGTLSDYVAELLN